LLKTARNVCQKDTDSGAMNWIDPNRD